MKIDKIIMAKMSKKTSIDSDGRLQYHTTIAATTYITGRLSNMKQRLGPRPESEQKKGRMLLYSYTEVIDIALDALERELDQRDSPISK